MRINLKNQYFERNMSDVKSSAHSHAPRANAAPVKALYQYGESLYLEMGSALDNGDFRITKRCTRRLKILRSWRGPVQALVS
jgi:hypothetical protein